MILITGATGKVGRNLVKSLLDRNAEVTAVTRQLAMATLPNGAHIVGGDPANPQTLAPALRGVEAIFVNPATVGDSTAELLTLAAEQGTQRVVLLSAVTVEFGGGYPQFAMRFKAVEDAVKASGLQWTILRCADFAANALAWEPQIRASNIVRGAYGNSTTSSIHERDIAAVGAEALLHAEHAGCTHVLTGPQPISQRDKVRIIGEVIGRDLTFEEVPPEQVRQALIAQGVPADVPDRMLGYYGDYVEHPGPSSTTVEQILGRPALSFAEWVSDYAAVFGN